MSNLEDLKGVAWKKSDAIVPRFLMRPLSIRITSLLIKTNLSPTHVTLFSCGLKLLAAWFFFPGEYSLDIAAGVLLYFSHVFDCVDGEMARVKNQMTRSGALLDIFLDRIGDVLVYFSVSLSLFIVKNDPRMLVLGMFVIASTLFQSNIGHRADIMKKEVGIESGLGVRKDFYFGPSGIELVLLPASIVGMLPEGMFIIGFVLSSYALARFSVAYVFLRRRE
jgi:phosphatidylglycerophosphate synthase